MNKYVSYLLELEHWLDDVENTLLAANLTDQELDTWMEQTDAFRSEIKDIRRNDNITGVEVQSLQEKGRSVFQVFAGNGKSIAYGNHSLPPLPYEYNALEPYISEEIMRLHHDKHHRSYVDGLNKAERALYIDKTDRALIKHWLREQAFNGSGHYLHTIFWNNMTPHSTKRPIKEIKKQIEKDFHSWQSFKKKFSDAADSVEGVGWAILFWNPRSGRLGIQTLEKHQLFSVADTIPLLVLDVWEHAYYLQYQTDKKKYIENWWNIVNWEDVNHRFIHANNLKWEKY
ncbi:superoxide dismutase [Oceanobacillus bengalensis]|uniref:superoxide dismutase n=1 Tax=Oceanobacillus bengalensis TaxID=1435466 RepID=A0A494Z0W2_9BACI|nr:superoxide dismutase [Oceanobacillus bengalensis]RKQ16104.1 superoxide dismutase [Oceanobacillus bengalensis]